MKVVALLPSRGLIHSKTIDAVLKNLAVFPDSQIIFTHNMNIPDAQNYLVDKALETDAEYFWFVEEDNVFPCDILLKMVGEKKPVVALDYPVGNKQYSTIKSKKGKIYWCGFGCTLIKKTVFDALEKPYFRTDKSYRLLNHNGDEFVEENTTIKYGGHDINFGMELLKHNIPIYKYPDVVAGHLKVEKVGARETNRGIHQIIEVNQILNYQES